MYVFYVCTYVRMYVCTYARMYGRRMRTCLYVCICVRMYLVSIYIYLSTHLPIHLSHYLSSYLYFLHLHVSMCFCCAYVRLCRQIYVERRERERERERERDTDRQSDRDRLYNFSGFQTLSFGTSVVTLLCRWTFSDIPGCFATQVGLNIQLQGS